MDEILSKLHKKFPPLPCNVLLRLYKVRCERLRMLMQKGIPVEIRWIIEAKVREDEHLPHFHLPGTGRSSFAKKRRAKRIGSNCHRCARWTCKGKCRSIGMTSINRDDKIAFIKDGLCKEDLVNDQISLETHPSGDVQRGLLDLWNQFRQEWQNIGDLRSKDPVCLFARKLEEQQKSR